MPLSRSSGERPRPPLPKHPYRDSAVAYGVMAVVLVLGSVLLGGDVVRTAIVAAAFFVVATGWSWWRFRVRIRDEAARAARSTGGAKPEEGGR